jgi:RNA methyltransferase, TrmH family
MKIKEISSSTNAVLKRVRALDDRTERKESGLFLIEGRTLIEEAIRKQVELDNVVTTRSFMEEEIDQELTANLPTINIVSGAVFKTLYTTNTSCGIVATAVQPKTDFEKCFAPAHPFIVVGDQIQDPGNLGTIIRTCLAFGVDALVLSKGSVDCFSPKAVRSSMGAIFALPIVQEIDMDYCLDEFAKHNVIPLALDPTGSRSYWELDANESIALIFGNEGNGLSQSVLARARNPLKIPIDPNCESLNVAVSVGIVLAHVHKQRHF